MLTLFTLILSLMLWNWVIVGCIVYDETLLKSYTAKKLFGWGLASCWSSDSFSSSSFSSQAKVNNRDFSLLLIHSEK